MKFPRKSWKCGPKRRVPFSRATHVSNSDSFRFVLHPARARRSRIRGERHSGGAVLDHRHHPGVLPCRSADGRPFARSTLDRRAHARRAGGVGNARGDSSTRSGRSLGGLGRLGRRCGHHRDHGWNELSGPAAAVGADFLRGALCGPPGHRSAGRDVTAGRVLAGGSGVLRPAPGTALRPQHGGANHSPGQLARAERPVAGGPVGRTLPDPPAAGAVHGEPESGELGAQLHPRRRRDPRSPAAGPRPAHGARFFPLPGLGRPRRWGAGSAHRSLLCHHPRGARRWVCGGSEGRRALRCGRRVRPSAPRR